MKRSSKKDAIYTYRCGEKVMLEKSPDQFVVRRLPKDLEAAGLHNTEQMSSASSRVTCPPGELENLMTEARKLAPTHHAYWVAETTDEFLITDRALVTFREPQSVEDVGAFAGKYALEIVTKYSDRDYLFRLTDETGMNPVKLVVKLVEEESDLLASVDHDLNSRQEIYLDLPTDPSYNAQWHLHRRRAPSADFDPRSSSFCEEAWLHLDSFGSADVVVGVTDDGCQIRHPDFNSPGKFAGWGYFEGTRLFRRGDPGADERKMHQAGANHGTSCAGVIAAETDGELTVGAAPGCRLLPIKWESDGPFLLISDSKLFTALSYVADKVDVLSNSWGSTLTTQMAQFLVNRIAELAQTGGRRGRGILFLWAAGNANCPLSHTATQDVPFTSGVERRRSRLVWVGVQTRRVFRNNRVGIPGLMHVAALASTAQRSHYSNYGAGIDVCAPSSNSHTYRRLLLNGLSITTATGAGPQVTGQFGGTSSATPLVAGIAALAISANPLLTALEVITILKETASKDLNMDGYPRTPPASFDRDTSWDVSPIAPFDRGNFNDRGDPEGTWSPWFGHGKVDAAAVVRRAFELAGDRSNRITVERQANLSIPDANRAGVVSSLFVSQNGRIERLGVRVDITHSWKSDLRVALRAPGGERVVLHNRSGGSANDIVESYDALSNPDLANFNGRDIRGTWSLEVSDHARFDRGTLNRWALEADIVSDAALRAESMPGRIIPDNNPNGITDTLTLTDPRIITQLSVELDITHTFIRDLRVVLVAPNGTRVVLHNRTGGSADNIQQTFTAQERPALASLNGLRASGVWTLEVSDHEGQDVGKLNRWALIIT